MLIPKQNRKLIYEALFKGAQQKKRNGYGNGRTRAWTGFWSLAS
jgi:hypothetical protein